VVEKTGKSDLENVCFENRFRSPVTIIEVCLIGTEIQTNDQESTF
tara:strand:+ start:1162 stop:1296 length:135 start_codon:yes stop_codon:yes gene_type:complete